MASAMTQTMQTCTNLASMTQTQMIDEDKIDPFPARTTVELEEMLEACRRTKEVLAREGLIYSKDADFSKYSDTELVAMNAFVRENSRMLSIILAGGAQHFWNGQGLSTAQELKNMYHYIDDKIKEFLMIDQILDTLDVKLRYGRKSLVPKGANPATHPELLAFTAIDEKRAGTSQESLLRLAAVCEKFAVQCRTIAQTRFDKMADRSRKLEVKEKLLLEVDSVMPMLRQHVLKIGLSKTQLKEKTGPQEVSGGRKTDPQGTGTHSKLTQLFTHRAVEDAHRAVEDCRERLMQEMLFRRAKVERRLKREEEEELEMLKKRSANSPGAKAREDLRLSTLDSYKSLIAADRDAESRRRDRERRDEGDRGRSKSPGHSDSEKRKGKEKSLSPQSKSRSKSPSGKLTSPRGEGRSSPRASPRGNSPSPGKAKGAAKSSPDKKGGTKKKAETTSPKARSKKK